MPRRRQAWSKTIEEHGVAVRLYERSPGSLLYREVRGAAGEKDRKSLGHRDKALAEQQARALARLLAEHRLVGTTGTVTFGTAWRLFQQHQLPLLSPERQVHVRRHAAFMRTHFGDAFVLEDLSQTHVDSFVQARRSGLLVPAVRPMKGPGEGKPVVRDDTIRNNLTWLAALLRWCRGFRVNGKPLMTANPLEGVVLPREKNVRRPIATEERYQQTMAKAGQVDPSGRLACLLALARYTGRRINALCNLRMSDVLLTADAIAATLAATGRDPALAQHMPHGAIRYRPETDKQGYDDVAPLSAGGRAAIDAYLKRHHAIGEAPMFPGRVRTEEPLRKMDAYWMLRRAEKLAKLPKLERGAFHPYRRLFASSRMHLPDVAVMQAGGWRSLAVMKRSYQKADPATVLDAIENAPRGLTSDTPEKLSAGETGA